MIGRVSLWGSRRLAQLAGHNLGRCDGSVMWFVYMKASNAGSTPRCRFADKEVKQWPISIPSSS